MNRVRLLRKARAVRAPRLIGHRDKQRNDGHMILCRVEVCPGLVRAGLAVVPPHRLFGIDQHQPAVREDCSEIFGKQPLRAQIRAQRQGVAVSHQESDDPRNEHIVSLDDSPQAMPPGHFFCRFEHAETFEFGEVIGGHNRAAAMRKSAQIFDPLQRDAQVVPEPQE